MIKINSLWIGPLSTLERLCILSHLKNGHEYHLWSYQPLDVPEGVILEDGNEILSESEIFCYFGPKEKGGGSVSAFSNWFRYKLILERGGWWCDTDVVCLKPFDFKLQYVVASERDWRPTTCVFKAPPQSNLMKFCWKRCQELPKKSLQWGMIGPELMRESVLVNGLMNHVAPPQFFCPVPWQEFECLLGPCDLRNPYAIHLWNEMWRREGLDKEAAYDENCLFEELKRRFT